MTECQGLHEKPAYKHDCSRCTYLGQMAVIEAIMDLYYCEQGDAFPTMIARYSDEPSDYVSGMIFAHEKCIPELAEALRRARALGLVKE